MNFNVIASMATLGRGKLSKSSIQTIRGREVPCLLGSEKKKEEKKICIYKIISSLAVVVVRHYS